MVSVVDVRVPVLFHHVLVHVGQAGSLVDSRKPAVRDGDGIGADKSDCGVSHARDLVCHAEGGAV